jgi:hypothetical protein
MEQETKVCFNCDWVNPIYAKYCKFCNAALPQILQEKPAETVNLLDKEIYKKVVDYGWYSPKFKKLLETAENMLEGTISIKEYTLIIEQLHGNIIRELYGPNGLKDNLKEFVREAKKDKAEEITDLCMEALYNYDDAFNSLKLYIKDRQPANIQRGLELALDAKNKICEALSALDERDGDYKDLLKKMD